VNVQLFSDILGQIYDAAIGVGRWESALELIARSFDSAQARIVFAARDQITPSFAWRSLRLGAPDLTTGEVDENVVAPTDNQHNVFPDFVGGDRNMFPCAHAVAASAALHRS